jgi:hypothetical protein
VNYADVEESSELAKIKKLKIFLNKLKNELNLFIISDLFFTLLKKTLIQQFSRFSLLAPQNVLFFENCHHNVLNH